MIRLGTTGEDSHASWPSLPDVPFVPKCTAPMGGEPCPDGWMETTIAGQRICCEPTVVDPSAELPGLAPGGAGAATAAPCKECEAGCDLGKALLVGGIGALIGGLIGYQIGKGK